MELENKRKLKNALDITKGIGAVVTAAAGLGLLFLNGSIAKDVQAQREERNEKRRNEREQRREQRGSGLSDRDRI